MTAVIAGDSIKPFLGHFQLISSENLEPWLKASGNLTLDRKEPRLLYPGRMTALENSV